MAYDIEYDSKDADYRTVVIRIRDSGLSHRCGYVSVPTDHPFFGKDYHHTIPFDVKAAKVNSTDPIGTLLAAFRAAEDDTTMEISYAANVHGGITYAKGNNYPLNEVSDKWWFGFDAGHCDDNHDGGQPLDYMIGECKKLGDFLKRYEGHVQLAA